MDLGNSVRRGIGQGDGAVQAHGGAGSVRVGEIYQTIDNLVGAERDPINGIGGVVNVEPCSVRTLRGQMEGTVAQQRACPPRKRKFIGNDEGLGTGRKTGKVIRRTVG